MDELLRLQKWYQQQCNGEWEHHYGVSITSCDNPGWWVKIDLVDTKFASKPFETIEQGDSDSFDPQPPWLKCYVDDGIFNGAGDPQKLADILEIFLHWC